MNLFNPNFKEPTELVFQVGQNKQLALQHTERIRPGHSLWQWKDGEVTKVVLDQEGRLLREPMFGSHVNVKKITVEKDCYYTASLNAKNAKKRFNKSGLVCN